MAAKTKEALLSGNITLITKDSFSKEVEKFISDTNSDVMSAIVTVAEMKKIEMESISKFINPSLKNRLEEEALDLRLIKPKKVKV